MSRSGAVSAHDGVRTERPRRRRVLLVLLALVALLGIGVVGCGDDDRVTVSRRDEGGSAGTSAVGTTTPGAGPVTTGPGPAASTAPPTLPPSTTTGPTPGSPTAPATAPATSVPVSEPSTTAPLPDGAVDLGSGVHLVVPAGWDIEWDDLGPIITDGVDHAALEVHVRPAGEDPAVALQAYVDGFDADFDAVAYSPVTWRDTFGTGRVTVQQYGLYYTTYAADDGVGDRGGLYALVRADGLTLLIDVWNEGGGTGLPDATADQLRQSLLAAPPVGDAVVRPVTPPFRVDTVHTQVVIDELTGFTLAPGFEVVAEGPGWARASDGWYDVELHAYAGIESLDAAMAEADLLVRERYTDVVYEPEDQVDEQLADLGLARRSLPWTALFTVDGTPCGGITTAWWAATDEVAHLYLEGFTWLDGDTIPSEAEASFMFDSAAMSIPAAGSTVAIAPAVTVTR